MSIPSSTHESQHASSSLSASMPAGEQISNSFAPPTFSLKASPTQLKEGNGAVQRQAGDLRAQMDRLFSECPVVDEAYLDVIHNASTAERQAILNDPRYIEAINESIGGSQATTVISALMEGSQEWRNPTANDFYTYFCVNGGSGPLPDTATMNCWESIMYAAFLAGQISADYIRTFYARVVAAADPNAMVWQQLGFSTSLKKYPSETPKMGQFIFYLPAAASVPSHIALAQGGDMATSLWNQPNNVDSLQRIQINDLATTGGQIFLGNPSW